MPKKSKRGIKNIGLKTLALSSLLLFILIFSLTKFNITIIFDSWLNSNISSVYSPLLDSIMFFIVNITTIINSLIISLIFFALLVWIKRMREAFILAIGIASAFFLEFLAKIIIHRLRPENALLYLRDYSFPSGHSAISALIFIFLIYAFKDNIKNKALKIIFMAFCILAPFLIGFSRIYVNVHWLSDVLGGFFLGIFCFAIFASYLHEGKN